MQGHESGGTLTSDNHGPRDIDRQEISADNVSHDVDYRSSTLLPRHSNSQFTAALLSKFLYCSLLDVFCLVTDISATSD